MEGSGSGQQTVKQLEDCSVSNFDNDCDQGYLDCKITIPMSWFQSCGCLSMVLVFFCALGTWVFSIVGALVAIPVGIKRKSLAPLVFFGTTGTMLDIIMGISACEREHAERQMKLMEAQNLTTDGEAQNLTTDGEAQNLTNDGEGQH